MPWRRSLAEVVKARTPSEVAAVRSRRYRRMIRKESDSNSSESKQHGCSGSRADRSQATKREKSVSKHTSGAAASGSGGRSKASAPEVAVVTDTVKSLVAEIQALARTVPHFEGAAKDVDSPADTPHSRRAVLEAATFMTQNVEGLHRRCIRAAEEVLREHTQAGVLLVRSGKAAAAARGQARTSGGASGSSGRRSGWGAAHRTGPSSAHEAAWRKILADSGQLRTSWRSLHARLVSLLAEAPAEGGDAMALLDAGDLESDERPPGRSEKGADLSGDEHSGMPLSDGLGVKGSRACSFRGARAGASADTASTLRGRAGAPSNTSSKETVAPGSDSDRREAQRDAMLARMDAVELSAAIAEERAEQIEAIHQDVVEVNDIMRDLANLVEEQQPMFDTVAENTEAAVVRTRRGVRDIESAATAQKQAPCVVS